VIALRLFTAQGFENTTIEQIADEAGVSERTFFRYFSSKASVLWTEFETEVGVIRAALASAPRDVPMMEAIRGAVVSANHYRAEDVPQMRMRMNLIATEPALSASAAEHYEAWERAVSEFAGARLGQPADSLYPLAVGRATLAACRAAYDRWAARADSALTVYLDAVLRALAAGFAPEATPPGLPGGLPSGQSAYLPMLGVSTDSARGLGWPTPSLLRGSPSQISSHRATGRWDARHQQRLALGIALVALLRTPVCVRAHSNS
jgi:mycofactocin system transcriptional regulator